MKSELALLAKKIRCELRRTFSHNLPSQLFSVRISRYKNRLTKENLQRIYIEWVDEPLERMVRDVVEPFIRTHEIDSGLYNVEVICIHRDVYFVSKSGDDSNCGDADHHFLTIERAMEEIHFTEDEDAIVSIKK